MHNMYMGCPSHRPRHAKKIAENMGHKLLPEQHMLLYHHAVSQTARLSFEASLLLQLMGSPHGDHIVDCPYWKAFNHLHDSHQLKHWCRQPLCC